MPCKMCLTGELDFYRLSNTTLWSWLVAHNVVRDSFMCPRCELPAKFVKSELLFRCSARRMKWKGGRRIKGKCNVKRSARAGTWFGKSLLSVRKIADFSALWLFTPYPKTEKLRSSIGLSASTLGDWSSYCREVCIAWLSNNSKKIGGPSTVVEIDVAKFGKKKRNSEQAVKSQWVFGGIERGSTKMFLEAVEHNNKDTLIQIIKDKILAGSTVISNCWKAYDTDGIDGFQNLRADYSMNFVDTTDRGIHTRNLEKMWRDVREAIPRFGRRPEHLDGYLAEYMFRRAYRRKELLHHFFTVVSKLYPPTGSVLE